MMKSDSCYWATAYNRAHSLSVTAAGKPIRSSARFQPATRPRMKKRSTGVSNEKRIRFFPLPQEPLRQTTQAPNYHSLGLRVEKAAARHSMAREASETASRTTTERIALLQWPQAKEHSAVTDRGGSRRDRHPSIAVSSAPIILKTAVDGL